MAMVTAKYQQFHNALPLIFLPATLVFPLDLVPQIIIFKKILYEEGNELMTSCKHLSRDRQMVWCQLHNVITVDALLCSAGFCFVVWGYGHEIPDAGTHETLPPNHSLYLWSSDLTAVFL